MAATSPATIQAAASPDARTLALAAGWKAGFLCSGLFVAGMAEADIAANDLEGGYPELQPHLARLQARILTGRRQVEVAFDPALPPRVSRFVPGRGCVQAPIGAAPDRLLPPPQMTGGPDLARSDARPWPLGDRGALSRLPARQARALEPLLAAALDGARYGAGARTSALLLVKDGRIIAERYARGIGMHTPQRTWSVAKSLTSALLGVAARDGLVDPLAPAGVPEWSWPGDPRAAITVDQLLRMQSGLWTDGPGNRTDALYFGGAGVAETAAVAPLDMAPGSRFHYANNDTLLAARVLMARLGDEAPAYAYSRLLWPLGMTRTTIESDWQGAPVLSSQVWMTARDMARLALLHLDDGVFAGQRLLPEAWVQDALTPLGPQPEDRRGLGYGRAIWLMGQEQGLPEGSFAFLGNRGQIAIIVPSERLIVVRRGFDPAGVSFDGAAFTREVIAALSR